MNITQVNERRGYELMGAYGKIWKNEREGEMMYFYCNLKNKRKIF